MTHKTYICRDTVRAPAYWVQDGWISHTDGNGVRIQARKMRKMREHTDTSTVECQYRKSTPNDPRCEGCVK